MIEAVESTFVEAVQAKYFNSNNALKYAMFSVLENALGEVFRACHAPKVSEAEMHRLVQTKAVEDTIVPVNDFQHGIHRTDYRNGWKHGG